MGSNSPSSEDGAVGGAVGGVDPEEELELTIMSDMLEEMERAEAEYDPIWDENSPSAAEVEQMTLSFKEVTGEGPSGPKPEMTIADMMREMDLAGAAVEEKLASYDSLSHADIEQLIISRRAAALKIKQKARRAAWEAQVKAEVAEREAYKLSMEGLTRRQVLGGSLEDQETLSRISVSWRKGLEKERCKFLFPQLFPIIAQRKKTRWHVIFADIDNLRLVSRLYKDVIDHTLSTISTHFNELAAGFDRKPLQSDYGFLKFNSVDAIRVFNRRSVHEYRGNNPFPYRQLYLGNVNVVIGGSTMAFWVELVKLLHHWGHEIHTAFYAFELGSIELMYEFLIKYLDLMPNLQQFAIIGRDRSIAKCEVRECPLVQRIREKPLPELEQLHSLIFMIFTPAALVEAMLDEYGETLRSVNIEGRGFDKSSGEFLDFGRIVSQVERNSQLERYVCRYQDCSRIRHWNFQLPFLNQLRLDYMNMKDGVEIANIFKTVSSCRASLRRLELKIHFHMSVPTRELLPPGMGVMLELPHLEYLELTVARAKVTNADFLLPLVALKELCLYYHYEIAEGSEPQPAGEQLMGIIRFEGRRGELYDSNVWTLLPELRLITIYSLQPGRTHMLKTVHYRDGYRRRQSRKQSKK